jgi:hypothetical protein
VKHRQHTEHDVVGPHVIGHPTVLLDVGHQVSMGEDGRAWRSRSSAREHEDRWLAVVDLDDRNRISGDHLVERMGIK